MSVTEKQTGTRVRRAVAVTARALLVPYLIAVALVVWLPASQASKVTGVVFRLARYVTAHFGIGYSTTAVLFEFGANVLMFVPLGLLLVAAWPARSAWITVLLGYAASATIELGQTLIPSRFPSLSDVVANTLGTMLGCVIARILISRRAEAD